MRRGTLRGDEAQAGTGDEAEHPPRRGVARAQERQSESDDCDQYEQNTVPVRTTPRAHRGDERRAFTDEGPGYLPGEAGQEVVKWRLVLIGESAARASLRIGSDIGGGDRPAIAARGERARTHRDHEQQIGCDLRRDGGIDDKGRELNSARQPTGKKVSRR